MKNTINTDMCYKIAFEAIVGKKDIQEVMDTAYFYTRIPSFIVNLAGELITIIRKDIPEFQALHVGLKGIPELTEAINSFLDRREEYNNHPENCILCPGNGEYHLYFVPLTIRGNIEAFYVSIYHEDDDLKSVSEAASIILKAVAEILEEQTRSSKRNILFLQEFISKSIFDYSSINGGSLKELFETYREFLKPGFLVAAIRPRVYNDDIVVEIRRGICENIEGVYCYEKQNILYILFTGIVSKEEKQIADVLEKILSGLRCICGITRAFSDIELISGKQMIAHDVLELGAKEDKEKTVFDEENYRERIFYLTIVEKYGKAAYKECDYELLENEDRLNGTQFYHTLKEYLLCGCNVGMTANKLFIHRNTMIYRLTKIKEILNLNVNEPADARRLLLQMLLKEIDEE